jgi:hypothetical protein
MIDYKMLTLYIQEELNYKDDVEISYYRVIGDKALDIKLRKKGNSKWNWERGEMISLDIYEMWLKKFERDESIGKILD